MRTIMVCMALLGCGLFTGLQGRCDETATGKKHEQVLNRMSGTWKIVAGVNQGKKLSQKHLDGSQVMIEKDTIVVLDPDEKELYKAKFQVDISTSPYQIDMVSDLPQLPKSLALGIFELRQDGWRLCYGLPGASRPEKFAVADGSPLMLFTMAKVDTQRKDQVEVEPIRKETIKQHQQELKKKAAAEKATAE